MKLWNAGKFRGHAFNVTHISAANNPKVATWCQIIAKTQSLYWMVGCANYLINIFMNINENMRIFRKIAEK